MTTTADIARTIGVSPDSSIIFGYADTARRLRSADNRWDWRVLHPEMKRRHLAMYLSHPGTTLAGRDHDGLPILVSQMGSGGAGRAGGQQAIDNFWSRWSRTYLFGRPTRMTPEGRAWLKHGHAPIAYPGSSNHEADTWENHAMAVDNVGWQDGWMVANAHRFGLKTFVNVGSEPWHTQPAGYGNSKSSLQADLAARGLDGPTLPPIPHAVTTIPDPEPDPDEEDDMERFDSDVRIEHTFNPDDGAVLAHSALRDLIEARWAVHVIDGDGLAWLTYRHPGGWRGDRTTPAMWTNTGTAAHVTLPVIDGQCHVGMKGDSAYRLLFDLVGVKR